MEKQELKDLLELYITLLQFQEIDFKYTKYVEENINDFSEQQLYESIGCLKFLLYSKGTLKYHDLIKNTYELTKGSLSYLFNKLSYEHRSFIFKELNVRQIISFQQFYQSILDKKQLIKFQTLLYGCLHEKNQLKKLFDSFSHHARIVIIDSLNLKDEILEEDVKGSDEIFEYLYKRDTQNLYDAILNQKENIKISQKIFEHVERS